MRDRAEIVEQGQPIEPELIGDAEARDQPIAVHEAQHLALDRRGDGKRGVARQRLAISAANFAQAEARPGMFAGAIALHRADRGPGPSLSSAMAKRA